MKCTSCGSSNLIEGTIMNSDGGSAGVFVPKDASYLKKMFGIGGSKINSYACVHCSNLQFTVDFDEKQKTRYLKFEGQPPSITERIGEDLESPH